jgi:hypothetical protein
MKTLKAFDFPDRGDRGTYDWEKLLDGKIYQLEQGKDFQCKPATIITMARNQAKKAGKGLKAVKVENGVVIQAYPLTDDASGEEEAGGDKPPA